MPLRNIETALPTAGTQRHLDNRIRWKATLPLWLLLVGLPGVLAAELTSPAIDWLGEGEITLTAGKESKVEILNRSEFPLEVRLSLIWSVEGGAKKPQEFSPEPTAVLLAPGSLVPFSLTPKGEATNSHTGILLARAWNKNILVGSLRRKVTFNKKEKPVPDAKALRFLVSEIKLRKYLAPWCTPIKSASVPLSPGTEIPDDPILKAFLREEQGDIVTAMFYPKEIKENPDTGLKELPIKNFSKFGEVGTYTGTLQATDNGDEQGGEKKAVTIIVTSTHHPIFALLTMAAALVLTLRIQRYTGVLRSSRRLRQRTLDLGAIFDSANENSEVSAGYSVTADIKTCIEKLTRAIQDLENSSFTSLDETSPAYLKVQSEIESLDSAAKSWTAFAEKLKFLKDELDSPTWDQTPAPPFEGLPIRPKIYHEKEILRVGRALTVKELEILAPQVTEAPATLERWKNLFERTGTLARRIEALLERFGKQGEQPRLEKVRARVETAREALLPFWNRLWIDPNPDLAAENEKLEEIEGSLFIEEVDLFPQGKSVRKSATYGAELWRTEKGRSFDFLRELASPKTTPLPPSYEQQARQLRGRSRAAEITISALAFLIALYAGMSAQYFGEPFGTWRDYVEIVVWAVTAQAVSDLLLKALDRLWTLGGTGPR